MWQAFIATLSPMLMMFTFIVIGFVLSRKKLCPDNTSAVLSKLETHVFAPSLTLSTFSKYCNITSLTEQKTMLLYCVVAVAVAIGLSYLLSPCFAGKGYERNIYRYSLAFANSGFMGNSIVPAILGAEALYYYLLFTLPINLAIYTWGVAGLIPKEKQTGSPIKKLLNPIVVAVFAGIVIGLTGLSDHLPAFVLDSLSGLGSCMGPVAMLLTGFLVGSYKLGDLLRKKKVYAVTALRLFVIPATVILLLKVLGADATTLTLCLFAYATPLGLNTVVFPAAYGADTSTGASMAIISHSLCVITIPVMYLLLTTFIL